MLKNLSILVLTGFSLLLQSCSSDPVQADLLNYVNNEIPKVAALETESVGAYASVSGENYTNDSTMYYKIKETVIPKYTEFVSKLGAISPKTPEVKTIHDEYIKASKDQIEAFKLILVAIDKQDPAIIKQANEDLGKARSLIEVWKTDLNETCKKHDVTLTK